jgi:hypothetical protein
MLFRFEIDAYRCPITDSAAVWTFNGRVSMSSDTFFCGFCGGPPRSGFFRIGEGEVRFFEEALDKLVLPRDVG